MRFSGVCRESRHASPPPTDQMVTAALKAASSQSKSSSSAGATFAGEGEAIGGALTGEATGAVVAALLMGDVGADGGTRVLLGEAAGLTALPAPDLARKAFWAAAVTSICIQLRHQRVSYRPSHAHNGSLARLGFVERAFLRVGDRIRAGLDSARSRPLDEAWRSARSLRKL